MDFYNYFSERYKELLTDEEFCKNITLLERDKLIRTMTEFDAPMLEYPDRYSSFSSRTSALSEAIKIFLLNQDSRDPVFDSIEFLSNCGLDKLFDIIEIQYKQLSSESDEYQVEINNALEQINNPFRLLNGRFIKIDAKQFEQDLKNKFLAREKMLRCEEPLFQSVFEEMMEAFELYERRNYKDCTLKAACSFESMMKVLLNRPDLSTAAANGLIEALMKTEHFSNIPRDAAGIMADKVLLSLPSIRNKCGSGHGHGRSSDTVPKSVANLSLNLASSLNTFLADLYLEKHSSVSPRESSEEEELPF